MKTLFKIQIEKETFIPGPYNKFAFPQLGITETRDEFSERWDLGSVQIDYLTEPDPEHYYSISITKGKPDLSGYLNLTTQGLILDPDKWIRYKTDLYKLSPTPAPPYFTDLSVTDFFREITDTLYKTIITDTSFIRVPIPRRQREPKTALQKAEEAAGFILHLREVRFDLLSGESDNLPPGNTLEFALNELNKLEKQYLELFTGKTYKQSCSGTVFITPDSQEQQYDIVKLLVNNGITELNQYKGDNISFTVTPLNKNISLDRISGENDAVKVNHFIYRIPDMATFRVVKGNHVVYEERATLYQAGKTVYFPAL